MKIFQSKFVSDIYLISIIFFLSIVLMGFNWKYAHLLKRNQDIQFISMKKDLKIEQLDKSSSSKTVTLSFEVTAYCPCKICTGVYCDGKTATGKNAFSKGVAVDTSLIPLGTKIYIPGYGFAEADDVGGAINGEHIDVRFKTHKEALEWGRQRKRITIFFK